MINDNFFKIDLHVHTISSNDYKGQKNEDEYIAILKSAIENQVDLICITDHSSVRGYKEIFRIKTDRLNLLQQLRSRNDVDNNLITTVQDEIQVFNKIHILMGIEVKLSPGIHYIVVFEESVSPDEVEKFLENITNGNISEFYGSEDYMLSITAIDFFHLIRNQFNNNFFIYAPHADSDSGVIEGLKNLCTERWKNSSEPSNRSARASSVIGYWQSQRKILSI